MESKLKKIFEHYGEEAQVEKLKEEIKELLIEIRLAKALGYGHRDFLEEVADVSVMCLQFALKYPKIQEVMTYKIDRQIDRMKS
jgi:hypothetical protein